MKKKSHKIMGSKEIHNKAVKIRKMTDTQLCAFVDSLFDQGYEAAQKNQPRSANSEG